MSGKIICICGPTASGKTALGVALAKQLETEVISADSMQVYRHMDIGTAKPDPAEMEGVPHRMLDCWEPTEEGSAARYAKEAGEHIERLLAEGRIPLIVGGTGLYYDAILKSDDYAPGADPALRAELAAYAEREGAEALLALLRREDPISAEKLHVNDVKRVIRAIEVKRVSGMTISEFNEKSRLLPKKYQALMIGLDYEHRQTLYDRCDRRVELMFQKGLLEEVERLLSMGVGGATAMQAIGYKETAAYLRGECTFEACVAAIKTGTRHYAKRQLTWFRKYPDIRWVIRKDTPDFEAVRRISTGFIRDFTV